MNGYIVYGIIISLSATSLVSLIPRERAGRYASIVGSIVTLLFSIYLLIHGGYQNSWFYGDRLSLGLVFIISLTYFLAVLHSTVCLRDIRRFYLPPNYYWVLLALFALSMILAVSSPNIGYAWFWLETSTIVSASLILVERGKSHVESAWRYILIASAGLGIALLSVILFGWSTGTFVWLNTSILRGAELVGVLSLLGFGAKAGLFPIHTWLPDAHGTAPSPVSAMLSGALLPSALLVYFRIFSIVDSELLFHLTVIMGLLTLWVAGLLMIPQTRFKRLLAYSSMDVMGIATVGIGATFINPGVMRYVLILFLAHALAKSSLFFLAGMFKRMGMESISQIKGLVKFPLLAASLIVGALTVTGAPPFPMFFGEFGILVSVAGNIYILLSLLGGILTSFLALNYHILKMLFGNGDRKMYDLRYLTVPLVITFLIILLSIFLYYHIWRWFS